MPRFDANRIPPESMSEAEGQFQVRLSHRVQRAKLIFSGRYISGRRVRELASSLIRNQVPGNRLRVRVPCPPLCVNATPLMARQSWISGGFVDFLVSPDWPTSAVTEPESVPIFLPQPCRSARLRSPRWLPGRGCPRSPADNARRRSARCAQAMSLPRGRGTCRQVQLPGPLGNSATTVATVSSRL